MNSVLYYIFCLCWCINIALLLLLSIDALKRILLLLIYLKVYSSTYLVRVCMQPVQCALYSVQHMHLLMIYCCLCTTCNVDIYQALSTIRQKHNIISNTILALIAFIARNGNAFRKFYPSQFLRWLNKNALLKLFSI